MDVVCRLLLLVVYRILAVSGTLETVAAVDVNAGMEISECRGESHVNKTASLVCFNVVNEADLRQLLDKLANRLISNQRMGENPNFLPSLPVSMIILSLVLANFGNYFMFSKLTRCLKSSGNDVLNDSSSRRIRSGKMHKKMTSKLARNLSNVVVAKESMLEIAKNTVDHMDDDDSLMLNSILNSPFPERDPGQQPVSLGSASTGYLLHPAEVAPVGETGKKSISDKYLFRSAMEEDTPTLLKMALTGFLPAEPHAMALNLTDVELHDLVRWIVEKSVSTPYSVMAFERASGKLVAFCLYSVSHRDETKDFTPFELDFDSMTENAQILGNLLDSQKRKIWNLCPNVEKVLRQEIIYVNPQHQRQGIASQLVKILDNDQLKSADFDGIQSEASSFANQKALSNLGFKMLSESVPSDYIHPDGSIITLPDETKTVQLFFYSF